MNVYATVLVGVVVERENLAPDFRLIYIEPRSLLFEQRWLPILDFLSIDNIDYSKRKGEAASGAARHLGGGSPGVASWHDRAEQLGL